MEFERSKINASIYGDAFQLTKPTVKQAGELSILLKKAKDDELETVDVLVDFLAGLGLPSEVSYSMEADHFIKLCEDLLSKKK